MSDGKTELIFKNKEKAEELMAARAWSNMGVAVYEDANPEGPAIKCTPEQVAALAANSTNGTGLATVDAHKSASVDTSTSVEAVSPGK